MYSTWSKILLYVNTIDPYRGLQYQWMTAKKLKIIELEGQYKSFESQILAIL